MGQILGLGITHYPGLSYKGNLTRRIKLLLADPQLPERLRSPENWHPTMREQWSTDEGWGHSEKHRNDMIHYFRKARAELDAFQPDFVLLWGDDQYENYREDCVPPFSVLAYDSVDVQPWQGHQRGQNWWDEPDDKTFTIAGHRAGAKHLVSALLRDGIDITYAYKPLHQPLGHAFVNSVLYLDIDRTGLDALECDRGDPLDHFPPEQDTTQASGTGISEQEHLQNKRNCAKVSWLRWR